MTDPVLGPRQGALVDAITQRIGMGLAPFNEHDVTVVLCMANVLGLPLHITEGEQ